MPIRAAWVFGLCLLFLVLLHKTAAGASAAELTQPLTAEEVACNEQQLEKLLLRMNAAKPSYSPPDLPTILLVSYSNSSGFYDGLVATAQGFRLNIGEIPPAPDYEFYLAFNLNPSIRTLRLNPASPELPQIGLSREESNSNLVTPGSYYDLVLTLTPTLGGGEPLAINNFKVPPAGAPYNGFLANSTKPGRGLTQDGLLTPCHEKLTDFDRHVFSVLQRMVRAEASFGYLAPDAELSIFRGEDPHTYRINYYPILSHLRPGGRLAVELKLAWTDKGELTSAVMTALPACTGEGQLGCTIIANIPPTGFVIPVAFLIPPVLGGAEYYPPVSLENGVGYHWNQGPSAPKTIDLRALLAHTTWNRPVW